ncbi:rhomboid family intramembrane serine protease [Gordonia sp. (in: high G+C Gram-positive bacteria)]|uniref:rhomboid family intramembrane serine protease n=1 Tax=Gordonia sp. (in: high G+C Gram-positive bacteria) TaxID=84139 RepID=UPI0039E668DE
MDPAAPAQAATATPYVTFGLIAVNVVLFLACLAQAGRGVLFSSRELGRSTIMQEGVLITGWDGVFLDEYWRLFTSGFLHWSLMHLAVNMISLYVVGRDLERLFGKVRYGALYLIALLGGSAAVVVLEHDGALTAGASGALYGLLGALLVVVLRLKLPATSVLTVIVLNVVISFGIPGISLYAHLGGLLFGALSALALLWLPMVLLAPEERTVAAVSRVGWIGLAALFVIASGIGIGYGAVLSL